MYSLDIITKKRLLKYMSHIISRIGTLTKKDILEKKIKLYMEGRRT